MKNMRVCRFVITYSSWREVAAVRSEHCGDQTVMALQLARTRHTEYRMDTPIRARTTQEAIRPEVKTGGAEGSTMWSPETHNWDARAQLN
jgi:hypothetical protein